MFPSLCDYAIFSPFKDLNLHKNETILTSKGINGLWKKLLDYNEVPLCSPDWAWNEMAENEAKRVWIRRSFLFAVSLAKMIVQSGRFGRVSYFQWRDKSSVY